MSRTIAFLIEDPASRYRDSINKCAAAHGLSAFYGIEAGNQYVVPGIKEFIIKQNPRLDVVYFVERGEESHRTAYEIYNETVLFRVNKKQPRLFSLLRDLNEATKIDTGDRYFVSCSEWARGDYTLFLQGNVENLVQYVTAMQTLGIWMWSPQTNSFFENDEYPLVFQFTN